MTDVHRARVYHGVAPTGGPGEWAAAVLQQRYDRWADHDADGEPAPGRWMSVGDVVAGGCRWLRELHPTVMSEYTAPPDTAATYLAGWYAGALADVVGYGLATAGAGIVLRPEAVRLRVHPDGWVDRIELDLPTAVVPDGHPWAGRPDVDVVDADEMLRRCVTALIEVVAPIVDGCHGLARVGRVGLWNEVADHLGLAFDEAVPAVESVRDLLLASVAVPDVPWRARPRIEIVDDEVLGPALIRRKGGCCLAYQCDHDAGADEIVDPDRLAFRERFGADTHGPHYCTTCKFRDPDDSRDRQLFWRRLEFQRRTPSGHQTGEAVPPNGDQNGVGE